MFYLFTQSLVYLSQDCTSFYFILNIRNLYFKYQLIMLLFKNCRQIIDILKKSHTPQKKLQKK